MQASISYCCIMQRASPLLYFIFFSFSSSIAYSECISPTAIYRLLRILSLPFQPDGCGASFHAWHTTFRVAGSIVVAQALG
ncbi:hypothetical protein B0I35DRAFT_278785 [Stachybotrys elegans]|uniref:Uncharacterized protein n=1 Tax=Stachybotrys elegans TaxID=80388 RepID=A0A8K0WP94_9HYPO|nr:hypothetical protein B0I35DRAFT_278785 [Stachybotrys elegans]